MRSLFFSTRADRVALARQRYFEEGERPSGVVSEAVFQSWARCLRLKQDPFGRMEFQEVSTSRAYAVGPSVKYDSGKGLVCDGKV